MPADPSRYVCCLPAPHFRLRGPCRGAGRPDYLALLLLALPAALTVLRIEAGALPIVLACGANRWLGDARKISART